MVERGKKKIKKPRQSEGERRNSKFTMQGGLLNSRSEIEREGAVDLSASLEVTCQEQWMLELDARGEQNLSEEGKNASRLFFSYWTTSTDSSLILHLTSLYIPKQAIADWERERKVKQCTIWKYNACGCKKGQKLHLIDQWHGTAYEQAIYRLWEMGDEVIAWAILLSFTRKEREKAKAKADEKIC